MIISLLVFITSLLCIYYIRFLVKVYNGIYDLEEHELQIPDEFITVIVPFRNEQQNILKCLKSIEAQNYPSEKYEVIFVDDNSDDLSYELLKSNIKASNIKLIKTDIGIADYTAKKRAILTGINESAGEIIVTTDADCLHTPDWLISLLSYFDDNNIAMVSGATVFEGSGTFADLQRLEFAGLIFTGAGLIAAQRPIICNGANLAYRKEVFFEVGGFSHPQNLTSGDDEILMQKISALKKYEIKFCINPGALVSTKPNDSVKEFFNQRKRWASKGMYYSDKSIVRMLVLIFLFYASFIIGTLVALFNHHLIFFLIIVLGVKSFFEFILMEFASNKMSYPISFRLFIPAELLQIPYIILSAVLGALGKFNWKDRIHSR